MARYLFTVWSFPGDMNPHIAVALALRQRGHDVAFYTGPRAAAALAALKLTHFPMEHVDEEVQYRSLSDDHGTGRAYSLLDLYRLRSTLRSWFIAPIGGQVADLEPILERWRPDVIVCDPMIWASFVILAETRSIPVVILCWATACMLSGTDALLWGLVLTPPTSPIGRLRNIALRAGANAINRGFRSTVNDIRARYGLAPLPLPVMDYAGMMPLYLVCSVPELDYNRRDLPPSVQYVGPCAWAHASSEIPPWLDAVPPDRPLVYVTEGTIEPGAPQLLQAAARGLASLPIQVLLKDAQILDLDRDPATVGLGTLAPNMRREGFVLGQGWQSAVIARCSVLITNGGAGSVLAALAAGVPLIVVPTTWDKPEIAQRVVAAGAGVKIAPQHCTPQQLREAVQHVLATPSYRENAQRIAASLRQHGGPPRAADLLEEFCLQQTGRRVASR